MYSFDGYLNFDYIFRPAGGAIAQMFFITNDVFSNDSILGGRNTQ